MTINISSYEHDDLVQQGQVISSLIYKRKIQAKTCLVWINQEFVVLV